MSAPVSRLCPVCRQEVKPTVAGNIQGHLDTNLYSEEACPAGGEPFRITLLGRRTDVWTAQVERAKRALEAA